MPPDPPFSEFLTALRRAGFEITIDDHVALARLLAQDADWDQDKLKRRTMYVVARTRDEQARFTRVFDSYFGAPQPSAAVPLEPATRSSPYRILLRAALVTAGVVAGLLLFQQLAPLVREYWPWPGHVNPNPPTPGPKPAPPERPHEPTAEVTVKVALGHFEPSLAQLLWFGAVISVPLLVGVAGSLRARRRRLYPQLQAPYTFELAYPDVPAQAIDPLALEDLALVLGSTLAQTVEGELDAARSARATAERGGIPELVWRARRVARQHLFLLANDPRLRAPRLQLEGLLTALQTLGVAIERYEFAGRIDRVWPGGNTSAVVWPSLLVAQFDTLCVFGDPNLALDIAAADGGAAQVRLAESAAFAPAFPSRLWLCPSVSMLGSAGARELAAAGWRVESAGLAALRQLAANSPDPARTLDEEPRNTAVDALEFYASYLGPAFALLCGCTLLPRLTQDGALFLLRRFGAGVPWDSAARLLGVPWLLDGQWPDGLEQAAKHALYARHAELARGIEDDLYRLFQAQQPSASSGAELAHALLVFEQQVKTQRDATPLFDRLVRSSAQVRERMRRSPAAQEWVSGKPLRALRLLTPSAALLGISMLTAVALGAFVLAWSLQGVLETIMPLIKQRDVAEIVSRVEAKVKARSQRCVSTLATQATWKVDPQRRVEQEFVYWLKGGVLSLNFEVAGHGPGDEVGTGSEFNECMSAETPVLADAPASELSFTMTIARPAFAKVEQPAPPPTKVPDRPEPTPEVTPSKACASCLTAADQGDVIAAAASYRQCDVELQRDECLSKATSALSKLSAQSLDKLSCDQRGKLAKAAQSMEVKDAEAILRISAKCDEHCASCASAAAAGDAVRAAQEYQGCTVPDERERCLEVLREGLRKLSLDAISCEERTKQVAAAQRIGVGEAAILFRMVSDCAIPRSAYSEQTVHALLDSKAEAFSQCVASSRDRLTLTLSLSPDGAVRAEAAVSSTSNPAYPNGQRPPDPGSTQTCVDKVVSTIKFPRPKEPTQVAHQVQIRPGRAAD